MGVFCQILLTLSIQGRLEKFLLISFFSLLLFFFSLQKHMQLIATTWGSPCSLYKWLRQSIVVLNTFHSFPPCPKTFFSHCDKCLRNPTEGKKDLFGSWVQRSWPVVTGNVCWSKAAHTMATMKQTLMPVLVDFLF